MKEIHYEYRKKPLYFKKYRYKITLTDNSYSNISHNMHLDRRNIVEWMLNNGYKHSSFNITGRYGYYDVYIKDKKQYEEFVDRYEKSITHVCLPAPGYENLYNENKKERILWYNKYPYKFMVKGNDLSHPDTGPMAWCHENTKSDWTKSGVSKIISFFFMNPLDAFAFKLTFADIIFETHMPDLSKVRIALVDRVNTAQMDLDEFDKNVKDSNLK